MNIFIYADLHLHKYTGGYMYKRMYVNVYIKHMGIHRTHTDGDVHLYIRMFTQIFNSAIYVFTHLRLHLSIVR